MTRGALLMTRVLDFGFALLVLIGLCWLLVILWLFVRLSSPGPGLFVQTRVGRHKVNFQCYKFRSMVIHAPEAGTHQIDKSHITCIGRILRASKLDELPQAYNLSLIHI